MRDFHRLSALEQATRIRRREVSVEEVTRLHLARIAALDGRLTAFVQVRPEAAIAAARKLDRELGQKTHAARGPLWGLPTGMKDLHLTRGFFVRAGSRAFRWAWSPIDDVTSATVRRAGLVIVGKLATSEFAIMPVVEPDIHAPTRNPWDRSRSAGGSSGGSAAAIAAGLLPLAPASDGAGSIRIPAAFSGLVGLKTTRGLVPNPFARAEPVELSVVGPHARDVDDAAALLDLLAGTEQRADSFLAGAAVPPAPRRIAMTTTAPLGEVAPEIRAAVERVAAVLVDLGHHLEDAPTLVGDVDEFLPMFDFLAKSTFVFWEPALQPVTRWLRERGRAVTLEAAIACRERFARRAEVWMGDADLALTPTVATAPPAIGQWRGLDPEATMRAAAVLGGFTAAFNASGQPAITLPVWTENGALPIGVQLIGRRGDDALLLATARAVLQALGHGPRVAPL